MYKFILVATITLMAVLSTISAKCDMMQELKPEFDDIFAWAKARCEANPELTDNDLNKAKGCYTKLLQPLLKSKEAKVVDTFVNNDVFKGKDTKNVCKDKNIQDKFQKAAMKKIGIVKAMSLKRAIEKDCPKYKKAFQDYNSCVKA